MSGRPADRKGLAAGQDKAPPMQLVSTLTCPRCGHRTTETMPTNACIHFHECPGCGTMLKPLAGDCCVFCSYGDVPCPPIQEARAKGSSAGCCG